MTLPKLKQFLGKHHVLPDKYRPLAYRMALKLPVCPAGFRELERKGVSEMVGLMEERYPIENVQLAGKMR
jgi:hypothetical protein